MPKREGKTTLWISDNMWLRLNGLKNKGESFEQVIDRFVPKKFPESFWEKKK